MATTTASESAATLRGGEWLLQPSKAADVFTPERLNEEQRLIAQTVHEFAINEVLPVLDRLDAKDWSVARALTRRAGELGLFGVDAPKRTAACSSTKSPRWSSARRCRRRPPSARRSART